MRVELSRLAALPDENAHSLSPDFYWSNAFLELEQSMLRSEWMCVGHIGEVRNIGDYVATDICDEQIVVVRGSDGEIRVLSNVCRHRGNRVANGTGNTKRFVCGYHSWTYDTAGALRVAPYMDKRASFEPSKCSLPIFRHEVWNGWIFVNLSGTADPLGARLDGLQDVVGNYHPEERHLVFIEDVVWDCNWKALFENFMEGYHLSSIHPTTLHPITPTRLSRKMLSGDAWTGYHAYYDPSYPPRGPFHPDLTEDECMNSPMYGVFPNLVVGMATNFTLFMCLRPNGVDRVSIRWGVAGLEDDPTSQAVVDYVELCRAFNAEDKEKLEVGPLAPEDYEGTIWDFVKYLARQLGS